jgi:hypothetical protein
MGKRKSKSKRKSPNLISDVEQVVGGVANIGKDVGKFITSLDKRPGPTVVPKQKRRSKKSGGGVGIVGTALAPAPTSSLEVGLPAAYGSGFKVGRPVKYIDKEGHFCLRHCEMFAEASVPTTWDYFLDKKVNVGNPEMFPYGSRYARLYTNYKFQRLCFMFLTRTGTTATGDLMAAMNPNNQVSRPASLQAFMNYPDAVISPLYKNQCYNVPKAILTLRKWWFVRYADHEHAEDEDSLEYDLGNIMFAGSTEASGGAPAPGYLFVSYDVCFDNEIDSPETASLSGAIATQSNMSSTTPFGVSSADVIIKGNVGIKRHDEDELEVSIFGEYLFSIYMEGTAIVAPQLSGAHGKITVSNLFDTGVVSSSTTWCALYHVNAVDGATSAGGDGKPPRVKLSMTSATTVTKVRVNIASAGPLSFFFNEI